jgi:transglutaminase-like putative cysteine protease
VYAPGLGPMDFHAVCEAWVDEAWQVVDATWLAPRQSLLRIATGRDAADTAFLTNNGAHIVLDELEVTAVADELPDDDWTSPAQLR